MKGDAIGSKKNAAFTRNGENLDHIALIDPYHLHIAS
jgi:hypothetical protein